MWIFSLIGLIPLLIIGAIIYAIFRRRKRYKRFDIGLSKEDSTSQMFFLLALLFLGVTILAFNKDLDLAWSWRTIVLITSVVGVISAYYFRIVINLMLSLIGLMIWWISQTIDWSNIANQSNIKLMAIFLGVALIALIFYLIGWWHENKLGFKRSALVYLILGILIITSFFFFFSTEIGLSTIQSATEGASVFASWKIASSLIIFTMVLIGLIIYAVTSKIVSLYEIIAIVIILALFITLALIPAQDMFGSSSSRSNLTGQGLLWAILLNVLVFFEVLGIIFAGYIKRKSWLINLGAFFLFILILIKYYDWFFTFLDKSLFFIGAGILLFAVGWFMEKGRRYMLKNINQSTSATPLPK